MNKIIKNLLLTIVITNVTYPETNKTFLATRPAGVNLAMEGTTWHTQIHNKNDKFGGSVQVVGFFQENSNATALGKYFGFNNKRSLVIDNAGTTGVDIDKRHLLHDHQGVRNHAGPNGLSGNLQGDNPFSGTLNLSAKHKAAGLRLDYQQDFNRGLYLKVRAPIIFEEHEIRLGLTNSISATIDSSSGATLSGINSTTVNIADYFSGSLSQSAGVLYSDQQAALKYAKINNRHDEACLGDIDILVGWDFWNAKKHHAGVNAGITVPTSPTPDEIFLWGKQCGNRGHFGLGAGTDTKFTLWTHQDEQILLDFVVDWRYLFEDNEIRILGLVGKAWGQYFLFGENGKKGVFPAANILTRKLKVLPGHQVDARFGIAYKDGNFIVDAGYNLYLREKERIKLISFEEGKYGIAGNNYNSGVRNDTAITGLPAGHGAFGADDMAVFNNVTIGATAPRSNDVATPFLTSSQIDTSPATTPSMITHKIYGGIGYTWNEWNTPFMIGMGGAVELASEQKALENWILWGKLGITF